MNSDQNLIKIGIIGKVYGLKGFFYFKSEFEIMASDELYLGNSAKKTQKVSVEEVKIHKGRTIVKLAEFPDRTALEKHLGQTLWAFEGESDDPLDSLIGKKVWDINKKEFGKVSGFYECGAGDIIIITNEKNLNLELPFNSVYFEEEEGSEYLTLLSCHSNYEDLWQS